MIRHVIQFFQSPHPRLISGRVMLALGKVRRLYYWLFRKSYIRRMEEKRKGECIRCGACCHLCYRCPNLKDAGDGKTECVIHEKRPPNCRIFPIDPRDLDDRDRVDPDGKCGYYFDS